MSTPVRDATHLDPLTGTPSRKAEHVVEAVAADWEHRSDDLGRLLDSASAALADRANHELRQVLAQLSTELELLQLDLDPALDARLTRMLEAIDRASDLVATHLDRNEVAKLLIHIHPETVDLVPRITRCLDRAGIPEDTVQLDVEPAVVTGDEPKLDTVLGYLIERLYRAASPEDTMKIHVASTEDQVEADIIVTPAREAGQDLIGELEEPLDIEAFGVDLPYARAVIERHGGRLYVQRDGEGLGFGLQLPTARSRTGGDP